MRPWKAKYCSKDCYHLASIKHKPHKCETCGKTFRRSMACKFCCRKCYLSRRVEKTSKVCPGCMKEFSVFSSVSNRFTYCSWKCRARFKREIACKRCGKKFTANGKKFRAYCSEKCYRPPVFFSCLQCKKKFRSVPTSSRRFCSFACYRRFRGETGIEYKVRLALKTLGVEATPKAQVGRWEIDFLVVKDQIAIEVDGVYWHRDKEKDDRKDSRLLALGLRVVRVREGPIKRLGAIAAVVEAFDEYGIDLPSTKLEAGHINSTGESEEPEYRTEDRA